MNRTLGILLAVCTVGAFGAATPVLASNPAGAYIGFGAGTSNVGNNTPCGYGNYCYGYGYGYGYGGGYGNNVVAWKVIAGIRPLPIIGAEVEYMDFGSANGNSGYYNNNYEFNANSHPKATLLYGIGYLPLPLPFLDVYGKAGVARLQTNLTYSSCPSYSAGGAGSPPTCNPVNYGFNQWNDKFAYGAGVQAKFQDFAFRAEYERISSTYGDPDAFTVSVTWTF
jgi:hypothetical protein